MDFISYKIVVIWNNNFIKWQVNQLWSSMRYGTLHITLWTGLAKYKKGTAFCVVAMQKQKDEIAFFYPSKKLYSEMHKGWKINAIIIRQNVTRSRGAFFKRSGIFERSGIFRSICHFVWLPSSFEVEVFSMLGQISIRDDEFRRLQFQSFCICWFNNINEFCEFRMIMEVRWYW